MKFAIAVCSTFLFTMCAAGGKRSNIEGGQRGSSNFDYVLSSPHVEISIPEIPAIKMEKHPLALSHPHLRLQGSRDGYQVSILTPLADSGMNSLDCASSRVSSIVGQYGFNRKQYILYKSVDGTTYSMFYPLRVEEQVQLHAHLFSGYRGTHCIEVHVSRIAGSEKDLHIWARGFPGARIRSL